MGNQYDFRKSRLLYLHIALSSRLFGVERANGYQIVSIIDVSNVSSRLARSPGPLTLWREPPSIFLLILPFIAYIS